MILLPVFPHADPNLANFAFLKDGRVIVYDLGCVKRIPRGLARGYAPLPPEPTDPYFDLLAAILREHPPYAFGERPEL